MAILEEEVWIRIGGGNVSYYENKGYKIPRYKDSKGRTSIKHGTKVLVKTKDLSSGSNVYVTKVCDNCNLKIDNKQKYSSIIDKRKKGKDLCFACARKIAGKRKRNQIDYKDSLEFYAIFNNKEYLLEEFSIDNNLLPSHVAKSSNFHFLWNCKECGTKNYAQSMNRRTSGNSICPYCHGKRVNHTNSLASKYPEICSLLENPKIGESVTWGSKKKENFKCPYCGFINKRTIYKVVMNNGFSCKKCSDGISFPEKMMLNVLEQLGLKYHYQQSFSWSEGKVYDFYLPEKNVIIETHGRQHFYDAWDPLEVTKANDAYKEKLVRKNSTIKYIIIDCQASQMEYIKNKIMESSLRKIINVSSIDWDICKREANSHSLVRTVCDLWNKGDVDTLNISKELNLNRSTVIDYLKIGNSIGLCSYSPLKNMRLGQLKKGKNAKPIVQLTKNGDYIGKWNSIASAEKYIRGDISKMLLGKSKTAGGYKWMYAGEYSKYINEQNNKEKVS